MHQAPWDALRVRLGSFSPPAGLRRRLCERKRWAPLAGVFLLAAVLAVSGSVGDAPADALRPVSAERTAPAAAAPRSGSRQVKGQAAAMRAPELSNPFTETHAPRAAHTPEKEPPHAAPPEAKKMTATRPGLSARAGEAGEAAPPVPEAAPAVVPAAAPELLGLAEGAGGALATVREGDRCFEIGLGETREDWELLAVDGAAARFRHDGAEIVLCLPGY